MSEKLQEIKTGSQEVASDYDWLASINLLRNARRGDGSVDQETWNQVFNEELSYFAENLDGPSKTTFNIEYRSDRGLVDAAGRSLRSSYLKHCDNVSKRVETDSRYAFQLQRVKQDVAQVDALHEMMKYGTAGETMITLHPFPEEAYREFGPVVTKEFGYQNDRLLGFVQLCKKVSVNELELTTVSLDNSDLQAYRDIASYVGLEIPGHVVSDNFGAYRKSGIFGISADDIRQVYDQSLSNRLGGNFQAGRPVEGEAEKNTYDFIYQQPDLNIRYFHALENLAFDKNIDNKNLIEEKQRLTVGYWTALAERYAGKKPASYIEGRSVYGYEIEAAISKAEQEYNTLSACGATFEFGKPGSLLGNRPESIMDFINRMIMEPKLIFKLGYCRVEKCPTQKEKKKVLVAQCSVCENCQKIFDKGENPTDEYEKKERAKKPLL